MRARRNQKGGTSTVELGPSIFIIMIIVFIPTLDMLHMGLAYCCGWYANHLATREAACAGPTKWQAAADGATAAWQTSPIGTFVRCQSQPVNTITALGAIDPNTGLQSDVQVQTKVVVTPMFAIPWITGQSVTFLYTGSRPLEETGRQ